MLRRAARRRLSVGRRTRRGRDIARNRGRRDLLVLLLLLLVRRRLGNLEVLVLGRLRGLHVEDGRNDRQRRRLLLGQLGHRDQAKETTDARVENLLHNTGNRPREEGQVNRRQSDECQLSVRPHLMILHIFLGTQRQVDACGICDLGRGVGGSVGEAVPRDTGG